MSLTKVPFSAVAAGLAVFTVTFLTGCETSPTVSQRTLPAFEARVARTDFQHVRLTAYTSSESDHRIYGSRNALGSELQVAGAPIHRAEVTRGRKHIPIAKTPRVGSAAADWGRWPAGTTFRLLSTGQIYRVDDYGWALSGRNTIDLYMANQREMNTWGVREEAIQILRWGDSEKSLRLLAPHSQHKHVRRMILELQDNDTAAAGLR